MNIFRRHTTLSFMFPYELDDKEVKCAIEDFLEQERYRDIRSDDIGIHAIRGSWLGAWIGGDPRTFTHTVSIKNGVVTYVIDTFLVFFFETDRDVFHKESQCLASSVARRFYVAMTLEEPQKLRFRREICIGFLLTVAVAALIVGAFIAFA
jgi:hypothetical protein